MRRMLPGLFLLMILASPTVSATVNHKVFHVSTSNSPIVIAILADHYTDEAKFENDVKNFITYGLMAHPYYATHASELQVETFFEPVANNETSKYGFNVEAPSENCVLSWEVGTTEATNTGLKISAVVGGINPRHTIVLGDHPYSIGCTDGEWTYVTEDAAGSDMLAHELGHGIGQLFDEWVLGEHIGYDHPGLSSDPEIARNCHHSNTGYAPPWKEPGAGLYKGCNLYEGKVFHAYDEMAMYGSHSYCLMGARSNAEFCPVCRRYMDQEFGYLDSMYHRDAGSRTPPPVTDARPMNERTERPAALLAPTGFRIVRAAFVQQPSVRKFSKPEPIPLLAPGATGPIVRLVVSFNPVDGTMSPRKAFPITARYAPNHRRFSAFAYEILNDEQLLGTGVVPGSLLEARGYAGGGGHSSSEKPRFVDLTIQMPGVTADMLKDTDRNFRIKVWQLGPDVKDPLITPETWTKLKKENQAKERGTVNGDQIRAVM